MKKLTGILFGFAILASACASAYDVWVPLGGAAVRTDAEAGTWSFWCSSLDGFTPLTASDGWTSSQMACPLCPNFRAFAGDYLVEMAKCGVDMILLDDDYRYGNLHDAELLCTCPLHLAKIEAVLGERIATSATTRR